MSLYVLVFLACVLVLPLGAYVAHGGGRSHVWGLVYAGEDVRGGGVYRRARTPLWKLGSAPIVVRVAALSSFFLGQMIIPGVLAAFVGFIATVAVILKGESAPVLIVLQLSAPTGHVVAFFLLAAGSAMLNRADDAVAKARRAARWAIGHNVALLAGLGVAVALAKDDAPWAIFSACYAVVSIVQALVVRRAAAAMEAYAARQEHEGAPLPQASAA